MIKLNAKNSEVYSKIYNYYTKNKGNVNTEVLQNEIHQGQVTSDTVSSKWKKFFKFYFCGNMGGLGIVGANIDDTLKYHFGRCDFKFEGNREYRNYVIEHKGIVFILSGKIEFIPNSKVENFPDIVMSLYHELFKMTIDYLDNNPHTMPIDAYVDKWRKKGLVVGNQHASLIK